MRTFTRSTGYARVRFGLGFLYVGCGAVIVVQMLHGIGLRFPALPGLVLGAAMIGLGVLRLRGGWPQASRP